MVISMEVLGAVNALRGLLDAKEERKAAEAFVESIHLQAKIKAVGNCEHLRKCDPTDEGGYATKQVIYDAIGVGKGRATKKFLL